MAYKGKTDLNASNIETDRWNRMDHILRMISYWQSYVSYGDIYGDIKTMYQGCQGLLDTITPDFDEPGMNEEGKKIRLRGMKTKKFETYRTILDQANNLNNQSNNPTVDPENRQRLKNSAYRKLQSLKYLLLQECERLGYNAKKTDTTDAYREGNN